MNNEQCNMMGSNTASGSSCCKTACCKKRLSWTAIIAAAFIGIGLSFLINLFSVGIGLSLVKTTSEGVVALAIGGFIALLIGVIVSMFVMGFAAGFLGRSHCVTRNLGVVYGFVTWCLALILMVLLASHVGRFISNYSTFVANPTAIVVTSAPGVQTTAADVGQASVVTVNSQTVTNNLGIGAFLIFVLFFVGAVASCFGGHCGMICEMKCCQISHKIDNTKI